MAPDDAPGLSVVLDHRTYFIQLQPGVTCLPQHLTDSLQIFEHQFVPLSVAHWSKTTFNQEDLNAICSLYAGNDDVWCSSFASGESVSQSTCQSLDLTNQVFVLVQSQSTPCEIASRHVYSVARDDVNLPNGPYMLEKGSGMIYQVSLLRTDTSLAFVNGVVSATETQDGFHPVSVDLGVPIPSRLYHTHDTRPLAGRRFAVKDAISIQGLRTGFGSQAWRDTYQPETRTAPCIQKLLNAGAVLVGVAKSTEFAEGVDPSEWIDAICPYNPRGDGQQKASSSSAGSAAAAAAYEWLDFTVGTDTGGSIRHPAGVQGLYGQRCSSALADLEGVLGASDLFNTVGIFARRVDTFCRVGTSLIGLMQKSLPLPKRRFNLLYPTRAAQLTNPDQHHGGQHRWFPYPGVDRATWTAAEKQIEITIAQLESALDCKRIAFNINELWTITPPVGQSRSLDEAVGHIYSTITTSSAIHTCIDRFISDYATTHKGSHPNISDLVQRRLDHGRQISTMQFTRALESMEAFARWAETTLFGSYDQEAMTLVIFPQSCGRPEYRDEIPDRTELFNDTFSIYSFGYLVGCPDYTIPVGEVPFISKVTGEKGLLPVSISLISRPGTDAELFGVVQQLRDAGVLRDVLSGARTYGNDSGPDHNCLEKR